MLKLTRSKLILTFVLLSVLFAPGCLPDKVQNVEADLSFHQLSFLLDNLVQNNTSWGAIELEFASVSDHPLLYFNLAVEESQVIRNMPLLSSEVTGAANNLWIYFPLGVSDGQQMETINYGYTITTAPLTGPPAAALSSPVLPYTVIMGSSTFRDPWTYISIPVAHWFWENVEDWTMHPRDKIVNQESDHWGCFPTAVSNSLKMLKKLHPKKLGNLSDDPKNDKDDTDIKKVIENIDFQEPTFTLTVDGEDIYSGGPNTATTTADPKAPWNQKKKWLDNDPKYPIETTIIDDFSQLDKVFDGVKDKCDVELLMPHHVVMITAVIKLENGIFVFESVDDNQQGPAEGPAGGTVTSYIGYDPKTKTFTGTPWAEGYKYEGPNKSEPLFMIECVK